MEEKTSKSKKNIEDLEIDAFDLLAGKMNNAAMNLLHKHIISH